MVPILLIVLFISQLFSFFFMILLNMKVAKLKDLEGRQAKVIREMDDAIGVYLIEMKEENDRLIQELKRVEPSSQQSMPTSIQQTLEQEPMVKPVIPVSVAANVYSRNKQATEAEELIPQKVLAPFEQEVLALYEKGVSIEEIAKRTQKGTTEIELLIKFHT